MKNEEDYTSESLADEIMEFLDERSDYISFESVVGALRICDLRITERFTAALLISDEDEEDCCDGCLYESLGEEAICSDCIDGSNRKGEDI